MARKTRYIKTHNILWFISIAACYLLLNDFMHGLFIHRPRFLSKNLQSSAIIIYEVGNLTNTLEVMSPVKGSSLDHFWLYSLWRRLLLIQCLSVIQSHFVLLCKSGFHSYDSLMPLVSLHQEVMSDSLSLLMHQFSVWNDIASDRVYQIILHITIHLIATQLMVYWINSLMYWI